MGADYRAFAVIGCEIDESKIPVKKERRKAFKHNHPDDGTINFDPKTGRALWEEVEYSEFTFEESAEDERTRVIDLEETGLELFSGTDDHPVVLGIGTGQETYSNGGEDCEFLELTESLDDIRKKLQDFLQPLGLWNPECFGLYSILYCSY